MNRRQLLRGFLGVLAAKAVSFRLLPASTLRRLAVQDDLVAAIADARVAQLAGYGAYDSSFLGRPFSVDVRRAEHPISQGIL